MRFDVERRALLTCALAVALVLGLIGLGPATSRAEGPPPPQSTMVFGFGWNVGDARARFDGSEHFGFGPAANGMAAAGALAQGTLQVNFTASAVAGTQTIAHLFSSENPSHGATLSLVGSSLRWQVTGASGVLLERTVPVALTAGEPHQVHVVVGNGHTWIHLDASPVLFTDGAPFMADFGLDSVHVGQRNAGDGVWTDGFTGTIQRLVITDGRVTSPEMQGIAPDNDSINRFPVALDDLETIRDQLLAPDKETPSTWVFTGDSITHGTLWTYGFRSARPPSRSASPGWSRLPACQTRDWYCCPSSPPMSPPPAARRATPSNWPVRSGPSAPSDELPSP